jgi:hypothetical protein
MLCRSSRQRKEFSARCGKEDVMCFIDSPIGRCERVREMVLLDQTQAECAAEHGCPPGRACPLAGCFYEASGVSDEHAHEFAASEAAKPVRRKRRETSAACMKKGPAAGMEVRAEVALTE